MKVITSTFKEFTKKKKLRTTLVLVLSESHYKQGFDWRYGKKKKFWDKHHICSCSEDSSKLELLPAPQPVGVLHVATIPSAFILCPLLHALSQCLTEST